MLDVFGSLAAASMVLCYALEGRGPGFTLAFAMSCAAAALYAFAIGSWPFFGLEALWAAVATRRGIRRLSGDPRPPTTKTRREPR